MNISFIVKKLGPSHASDISALISNLLERDWKDLFKPQTIRWYQHCYSPAYFSKGLKKNKYAFGAYVNNKLVGIWFLIKEDGGVGTVDWLGVEKEFRGLGIATALLEAGEKLALSLKLHYLYLYTEKYPNIAFYTKRGFTLIGTHKNAWFGETEHMMGKQLRETPFPEAFMLDTE